MACPGFILAQAENNIRWEDFFSAPIKKSAPPQEFHFAPGAEQAIWGTESEKGRNI